MYTIKNFRTKKQLKEAVARGEKVRLYAPGLGKPTETGTDYVEGPHYPEPHRWYAQVEMKDGIVVKVKNPGTNWHVDRANELREKVRTFTRMGRPAPMSIYGAIEESDFAAEASRRLGMNPTKKRRKSSVGKGLLPLVVIGGLAWLLLRNK